MDFDDYSDNYKEILKNSLKIFRRNPEFFDLSKVNYIKEHIAHNESVLDILDFGCGIGKIATLLAKEFRRSTIYGYDIAKDCLLEAARKGRHLENIHFFDSIPEKSKFDLVVVANVFHHIIPEERVEMLNKIKNLLKTNGRIIIFEHNPYNPLTRYVVNSCPYDQDAILIARQEFIKLAFTCHMNLELSHYILVLPWQNEFVNRLNYLLRHIPLGVQYMLSLRPRTNGRIKLQTG